MKIVDIKPYKSKAQEWREIIPIIIDKDKAIFIELYPDVHAFGKIAKSMGYKAKWKKQTPFGWLVWVTKRDN